jgi:hypothetical protein
MYTVSSGGNHMGLGNNRDYKSRAVRITRNLRAHQILMERNMLAGESREEASKSAMRELKGMTKLQAERLIERHTGSGL